MLPFYTNTRPGTNEKRGFIAEPTFTMPHSFDPTKFLACCIPVVAFYGEVWGRYISPHPPHLDHTLPAYLRAGPNENVS